ncbi:REP element-mobilizing transposase RayT [Hymenobacter luteus]|uniref:REP element-mobilizing transposase RayT n=2 Tax=Hymenobacter TaxID=89966 RepID=A0A7W9SWL3_9BACT|nr:MULTISPECIES: transposase [Hymenobacter]MBB4600468.1 REP element-mobilizing transposase RayT [Hymenobacter latericoloratus]MBB6057222.1 REP element-mobilizing transposase RayT [Hymenobacter luteus]
MGQVSRLAAANGGHPVPRRQEPLGSRQQPCEYAIRGIAFNDYLKAIPLMAYSIRDQQALYFLTFSVVEWVDIFTRPLYKDIVIDSLRFCQQRKGLELFAFCLMTNHLHLICRAEDGKALSDIVRDFKKYTSRQLFEAIHLNQQESRRTWLDWIFRSQGSFNSNNSTAQIWQQRSHGVELRNEEMVQQRLHYTHQNPVRAGICYRAEDYLYSSASQYAGLEALLPVTLL